MKPVLIRNKKNAEESVSLLRVELKTVKHENGITTTRAGAVAAEGSG